MSRNIIAQLEAHPWFRQATTVLLYHALPDEVNTHELIHRYAGTKRILLPAVEGESLSLHVYDEKEGTRRGAFHIQEAKGPLFSAYEQINLAVIPGMAFDAAGHRLGRGKGYYDRLLPQLACPTIGLCFSFQLVHGVPTDAHDRKVDRVLSNA